MDSEEIDHLLTVVVGVSDQLLADRIDDEVEQLQRYLSNENGAIVRELRNFDFALPALNRQLNNVMNKKLFESGWCARQSLPLWAEPELPNQP